MRELTVCHTKWQCELQAPQFLSQKQIFNYDFIKKNSSFEKKISRSLGIEGFYSCI